MFAYIGRRLLLMIPTLLGVLTVTFVIMQFVPGGPVEQVMARLQGSSVHGEGASGPGDYHGNEGVDPAQVAAIRHTFGFDVPPLTRYVRMLTHYARFDLGQSFFQHRSVWALIVSKLPVTVTLGTCTLVLTYLIAVPLAQRVLDRVWHLVLPVTASVASSLAVVSFLTRNAFIDELSRQYVLTARAKGVSRNAVVWRHVLRNALIPIATGFPAAFVSAYVSGSLLIETLFSLDGVGRLSYDAIIGRDYPVVLGSLFVFTAVSLFAKLAGDLAYVLIDPRIHFGGNGR